MKKEERMKIAIVDVGGGLKGIYSAGILDRFLEERIDFELGIGVSAGSANLASFLARQEKRNYVFYTEYSFRRKYMSLSNFVFRGSVVDLDYVYGTLSNSGGEYPLDYETFKNNPMDLVVVATNAWTGEAKYFPKESMKQDDFDVCKASSCIPYYFRPYVIDGVPYYDGAVSDPVPIEKAFELGTDKIVLILSRPIENKRTSEGDEKLARKVRKKYPKAAENFALRAKRYNDAIDKAKKLQEEGKACILSPKTTYGISTLSRKKESLEKLYSLGYEDAKKAIEFVKKARSTEER